MGRLCEDPECVKLGHPGVVKYYKWGAKTPAQRIEATLNALVQRRNSSTGAAITRVQAAIDEEIARAEGRGFIVVRRRFTFEVKGVGHV